VSKEWPHRLAEPLDRLYVDLGLRPDLVASPPLCIEARQRGEIASVELVESCQQTLALVELCLVAV
jgi:hypothetical protein